MFQLKFDWESIKDKKYYNAVDKKLNRPSLFEEIHLRLEYENEKSLIKYINTNLVICLNEDIYPILNWIVSNIGETGLYYNRQIIDILCIIDKCFQIPSADLSLNDISFLVEFNEYVYDNYQKFNKTSFQKKIYNYD